MSAAAQLSISKRIASDISASENQVNAAIALLDDGATVPFISRYRKEATGGLSDAQLRDLEDRLAYLRDLHQRRGTILEAIEQQGKLTDELRQRLDSAQTKAELEDLYLPYKKKRRTKGQIAIEAGLQALAEQLWNDPQLDPEVSAKAFVALDESIDSSLHVKDTKAALEGARYILMERFAEDASLIARLRTLLQEQSYLCATVIKGKQTEGVKFSDYFDHQELFNKVPGHRALAMLRGRSEGFLSLHLLTKQGDEYDDTRCIDTVGSHVGFVDKKQPADSWRAQVVSWTWKVKLSMHLESELLGELKAKADNDFIVVVRTS